MTLTAELNQKAKAILIRELGPVDYARFFQQYEEGLRGSNPPHLTDIHPWQHTGHPIFSTHERNHL